MSTCRPVDLVQDPVAKPNMRGPSKRGAGAFFDSKVTQEFLKVNKLKVLLRSHEKRQEGAVLEILGFGFTEGV
ncbi:unnamed protein product [Cladocopium goreaui]|uniref:Serine/threonine-protein phosphatase 5 (LePP5) n=1 Tax=Cladocopium goreaui TaxID=2562237 RepID=A0A9P1DN55_9DINO|nr:unnamed protein product [Cladocopium goreaui]